MIWKKTDARYITLITGIASLGGFLFGFGTGVISGALPFLKQCWGGLSASELEWITTSGLIGAVIGALVTGKLTDNYGRKYMLISAAIIFAIGSALSGAATSAAFLTVGRAILGISVGMASFITPLYISETSPANHRGTLVAAFQLMITIGIFASYTADLALADELNPFSWRWMFYIGIFPAIVLFLGMLFLPESPRYLLRMCKTEEGREILERVGLAENIEDTVNAITCAAERDRGEHFKWRDLFKAPFRYAMVIAIGIMFFQQFVGINTVIYYIPGLFLFSDTSSSSAAIVAMTSIAAVNMLATIFIMFVIDKIGRRKLFVIGLAGMFVSLITLASLFKYYYIFGSSFQVITIFSVFLYVIFFAISIGPLAWILISEIFPLNLRGVGMSIGALANWLFNSAVTFLFIRFTSFFGSNNAASASNDPNLSMWFLIYALVALVGIIWGWKYIPETRNVSLEQIEDHWESEKKPREKIH